MTKPLKDQSLRFLKELVSLMNDTNSKEVVTQEKGIEITYTLSQIRTLINQKEGNEDVD